jgi:hypothetical protein
MLLRVNNLARMTLFGSTTATTTTTRQLLASYFLRRRRFSASFILYPFSLLWL